MLARGTNSSSFVIALLICLSLALPVAGERRRGFSYEEKKAIFDSCEGKCFYCGKELDFEQNVPGRTSSIPGAWQVEHLWSHAIRGSDELHNLVAACVNCNQRRSNQFQSRGDHRTTQWMMKEFGHVRCHAFTRKGTRCKIKTDGDPYCEYHDSSHRYGMTFDTYFRDVMGLELDSESDSIDDDDSYDSWSDESDEVSRYSNYGRRGRRRGYRK